MLVIASDVHRAHRARQLDDGEMGPSAESPERAEAIGAALDAAGHERVVPDELDLELLCRVHDADYVEFLRTAWEQWKGAEKHASAAMGFVWPTRGLRSSRPNDIVGLLGYHSFTADSSIVEGTFAAAIASAAAAETAAACVVHGGTAASAYALSRPPGHHATADQFGGYCYLNNAAVAAQRLRDAGIGRVGILDVDYHHGNGTESIFLGRGDVAFCSIHADPRDEFPWFAGFADERGHGDGAGANLNLPLPCGTGVPEWFVALDRALDFLVAGGVEALVVSLGVDTYAHDPLGTFGLETDDFSRAAASIRSLELPTVIVQEGGYATEAIGVNVAAFLDPWS